MLTNLKTVIFNYFLNQKYNFIQNIVDWYKSMKQNYLIDCDRKFVIYTDNEDAKNQLKNEDIEFVDVKTSQTNNICENKLCKFKYILDCIEYHSGEFDYFSFIQSNARCIQQVTLKELTNERHDLVVFQHCSFPKRSFKQLYFNKIGSIVDISNINTQSFTYVQNCHFIGNKDTIVEVCNFINKAVEKDRHNPKYASWQYKTYSTYDEAYFNYYLNLNLRSRKKVNILDGHIYIHAPYSNRKQFKIDMINKNKPYQSITSKGCK